MPTFKNINQLKRYIASEKGGNLILRDEDIRRVLIREAQRLQRYLREELQSYFNSYDAAETHHKRTGDTIESIKVREPHKSELGYWSIEIYWDDDLAYHDSVFGQEQGHTGWLLNVGWDIEKQVGYSIPNFTKFEGTGYIEKSIERWNKTNKLGLKITLKSKWL